MVGSVRKRVHENKTEKKKNVFPLCAHNYFRVPFTYASSLPSDSVVI